MSYLVGESSVSASVFEDTLDASSPLGATFLVTTAGTVRSPGAVLNPICQSEGFDDDDFDEEDFDDDFDDDFDEDEEDGYDHSLEDDDDSDDEDFEDD